MQKLYGERSSVKGGKAFPRLKTKWYHRCYQDTKAVGNGSASPSRMTGDKLESREDAGLGCNLLPTAWSVSRDDMEQRSYRIILEGTIIDGLDRHDVVTKLAVLFGKDAGTVEKLLSGRARPIRTGIDLDTAKKYRTIIKNAGAVVRIEQDTPVAKPPERIPEARAPEFAERGPGTECPRCGYSPMRSDDVLIVRGDCPRCGFLVRKTDLTPISTESEVRSDVELGEGVLVVYGEREPASWLRRSLAGVYSFGVFLLVYWCVLLLFIFAFFPPGDIPSLIARDFIFIAAANFPLVLSSMSMCLVLFVFPLFRNGSTPGQQAFGIRMSFLGEGELTALVVALALRVLAVGTVSFVPGILFLRVWGLFFSPLGYPLTAIVVMAGVGWAALAIHAYGTATKRGVLDVVTGSIQTEEGLLPTNPWKKALTPLSGALAFLVLVGLVLPYVFKG